MAAIETCFKKTSGGDFGDFSEQQLVDCGYQQNGANGCNGAPSYSYIQYVADSSMELTHESTYPYLNTAPTLTCPTTEPYNIGAKGGSKIEIKIMNNRDQVRDSDVDGKRAHYM